MQELLTYTLSRIDSLQHFYISELSSINKKSQKGMKENRISFLIDLYFQLLTSDDENDRKGESFDSLKAFVEKYITIKNIEKNDDRQHIVFEFIDKKPQNYTGVKKGSYEYQKYAEMPQIHGHNTLTMLITRFEEFIANFLKGLFLNFPEKYLNNQNICFSEIINVGVDEIKNKIVNREVENKMFESYTEWFKLFESHNMNFSNCKEELQTLKEIYARRNIFVHNSGKVNELYLKNVPNSKFKIGERLTVDDKYLQGAFDSIKKIIFIIIIESSRLKLKNKSQYENDIFYQAFEELCKENYVVSKKVFEILKEKNFLDNEFKLMSKINYWISAIELDGLENVIDDINNFDTSAYSKNFKLAKLILLNEYEEATNTISQMFDNKEISAVELLEWPLFKAYRQTAYFENFRVLHSDKFNVGCTETAIEDSKENTSIRSEIEKAEIDNF